MQSPKELNANCISEDAQKIAKKWNFLPKKRYIVTLMVFFGMFNAYSLRSNLSVAIVAMTEMDDIVHSNGSVEMVQEFNWTSKERGIILSSFFYGHALSQTFGGLLCYKFGGTLIFGLGIGITSLLTLLTPIVATFGTSALMMLRVMEGLAGGATFPSMLAIYSHWAPLPERSRILSITYTGFHCGTVVSMFVSGILANEFGWRSIFYVSGGFGCLWYILWLLIIRESPEIDKWISEDEVKYIRESLRTTGGQTSQAKPSSIPWKSILTSLPVYAVFVAFFSENWGFYTLFTQLPTFLRDTMDFDLKNSGLLSALPYLTITLLLPVSGYLADFLKSKGYLNNDQVRRYFTVIPFLWQSLFLLIVAFYMDPIGSILCIALSTGIGSFAYTGFGVVTLDMAPQYASVICGITNTLATIPGIVSPSVTGWIVQNKTPEEWRIVFCLSSAIYFLGSVLYWFWASAKLQTWAQVQNTLANTEIDVKKSEQRENGDAKIV